LKSISQMHFLPGALTKENPQRLGWLRVLVRRIGWVWEVFSKLIGLQQTQL